MDSVTVEEFDRLFAQNAGPYLRVYLALRLRDEREVDGTELAALPGSAGTG